MILRKGGESPECEDGIRRIANQRPKLHAKGIAKTAANTASKCFRRYSARRCRKRDAHQNPDSQDFKMQSASSNPANLQNKSPSDERTNAQIQRASRPKEQSASRHSLFSYMPTIIYYRL